MPEPVPSPTPAEIETVAEMTLLSTDVVTAMVANYEQEIADAKWALTLDDILDWDSLRNKKGDIKKVGSIEFFEGGHGGLRLRMMNRVRARYGYQALINENGRTLAATSGYAVTVINDY